jgi:HEAT repeat protein
MLFEQRPEAADLQLVTKALRGTNDPLVQQSAVRILGMAKCRDIEPTLAMLRSPSHGVREAAVDALGQIGDRSAVAALVQVLGDSQATVRCAAAEALGKISDEAAASALIQMLEDRDEQARLKAVEVLGRLGSRTAVPVLVPLLEKRKGRLAVVAATALGCIRDTRAVEPLLWLLEHQGGEARRAATCALGQIGDTRASDALLEQLNRTSPTDLLWQLTVGALVDMKEMRLIEPMARILRLREREIRVALAGVLNRCADSPSDEQLIADLLSPGSVSAAVLRRARQAWLLHGHPFIGVTAWDGSPTHEPVRQAIWALGRLAAGSAEESLMRLVDDPSDEVRAAAASTLHGLGIQFDYDGQPYTPSASERDRL